MLVKEAMRRDAYWISPETTVKDAALKMRDLDIGSLPIGENDRLIGMVTDRDIALRCCADGKDPAKLTAREVMTRGISWCFEDQTVEDAAHLMESKHVRRLPVLSREKRMIGYLSVSDLAAKASHELCGEVVEATVH